MPIKNTIEHRVCSWSKIIKKNQSEPYNQGRIMEGNHEQTSQTIMTSRLVPFLLCWIIRNQNQSNKPQIAKWEEKKRKIKLRNMHPMDRCRFGRRKTTKLCLEEVDGGEEVEGTILNDLWSSIFNFELVPMKEGQRRCWVDLWWASVKALGRGGREHLEYTKGGKWYRSSTEGKKG